MDRAGHGAGERGVRGARSRGGQGDPWLQGERFGAEDVAVAIAWRFGQYYTAEYIPASRYPALVAYSARAESRPEFLDTPLD